MISRIRFDVYALGYGNGAFTFSPGDRGQPRTVEVTYRTWDEDAGMEGHQTGQVFHRPLFEGFRGR